MSDRDDDDGAGFGSGSGCIPLDCFKSPFIFFSFLIPLLCSVSFLPAATPLGLYLVLPYFYPLKSPFEPALLQSKILYRSFYLLIHYFYFLFKFLHKFSFKFLFKFLFSFSQIPSIS